MRWSAAIVATGRGKRVCTGFAARAVEKVVLPWTCSGSPVPTDETKRLRRYIRHAGDTHNPESLLQCPNLCPFSQTECKKDHGANKFSMRDREYYQFTKPPKALLKARLDNIAIIPASMLPLTQTLK